MKLTRIILETDEHLRELERVYRESNSEEDRQNYIRALSRIVPELAEALHNYEELSEARYFIDTENTGICRALGGRRLSEKEGRLVDTWAKSGQDLNALFNRFNVPEPCHEAIGLCGGKGLANFVLDPWESDVNNDHWAYVWMCENCVDASSEEI